LMTEYFIRHRTVYSYESEALESQNLSCLVPVNFPAQEVLFSEVRIDPAPEWSHHWLDVFGNRRDAFSLSTAHDRLEVELLARVRREIPAGVSSQRPWEEMILPDEIAWRDAPPMMREFCAAS